MGADDTAAGAGDSAGLTAGAAGDAAPPAAAYMASRRLWLPIALHAGWNFAQLGLLGVQRLGHSTRGAWSSHFTGPPLLSGGDWGPEISIVALVICLVASILLLAIAQWRGRTIAPSWAHAK